MSQSSFETYFKSELKLIESHLQWLVGQRAPMPELDRFWSCMGYSVFSGGKRFRPLLSLLTAKALGRPPESALALASAVELVHTYSLIHDDLPCMDNDDLRRGQPTNHKVYGEAGALLAGDALLTMAFGILAQSPSPHAAAAVASLAAAAGARGMVGGQILDIEAQKPTVEMLQEIHHRKTGALIGVAVEAAALLCAAEVQQLDRLREYGRHLGMAFQLADDLQDFNAEQPEKVNFASLLGVPETFKRLEVSSSAALEALTGFGEQAQGLRHMVELNRERI